MFFPVGCLKYLWTVHNMYKSIFFFLNWEERGFWINILNSWSKASLWNMEKDGRFENTNHVLSNIMGGECVILT